MPISPKPRCRICKRLHCADPAHKRQPRQSTSVTTERRPEYNSSHERKRRAAVVAAFLAEHGHTLDDGTVIAYCPDCRQRRAHFIADHVVPVAMGGTESGELRVHCRVCSGRQGALIAARRRRHIG